MRSILINSDWGLNETKHPGCQLNDSVLFPISIYEIDVSGGNIDSRPAANHRSKNGWRQLFVYLKEENKRKTHKPFTNSTSILGTTHRRTEIVTNLLHPVLSCQSTSLFYSWKCRFSVDRKCDENSLECFKTKYQSSHLWCFLLQDTKREKSRERVKCWGFYKLFWIILTLSAKHASQCFHIFPKELYTSPTQ